jgi:hypothetical protein
MATTKSVAVSELTIDLSNFRTVPQPDEDSAIKAMIAVKPDYFWALLESLLDTGYLPTENIIVLKDGTPTRLIVKEGNRRIAALKLALGLKPLTDFGVPNELVTKINALSAAWKRINSKVPCAVYDSTDAATVDRIVTLTHGKSEKAGRDQWQPVARARHNRDVQGASEPALDLLEKYLQFGRNVTAIQRERWAGDYPLSVLAEAVKKLAKRVGATSSPDLANRYFARVSYRDELEEIFGDIGLALLRFEQLRGATDFAVPYGIPLTPPASGTTGGGATTSGATTSGAGGSAVAGGGAGGTATSGKTGSGSAPAGGITTGGNTAGSVATSGSGTAGGAAGGGTGGGTIGGAATGSGPAAAGGVAATPAFSTRDPKAVQQTLKLFTPVGANRQKVVLLRDEAIKLNLKNNPIAFCFLLRSMFEISAKVYCQDNASIPALTLLRPDGKEKPLIDLLRAVTHHLTHDASGKRIIPMEKKLHGALTEMAKFDGILSVTSMNSLVHSTTFSISFGDVCTTFGNIYPLLEAMN